MNPTTTFQVTYLDGTTQVIAGHFWRCTNDNKLITVAIEDGTTVAVVNTAAIRIFRQLPPQNQPNI